MAFKVILFCVQISLIKMTLAQCIGPHPGHVDGFGLMGAAGPFASPLLLENFPMPTPGLSIMTDDLIIEGIVSVAGSLPFLGTVAVEGLLPTEGLGTVTYGCGNGEVGITGENPNVYGAGFPGPVAPGYPMGPGFPMGPAFGPYGPAPAIDPGMAAVRTSLGI